MTPPDYKNKPRTTPHLQGPTGAAWRKTAMRETNVANWIVYVPMAHPFWNWYLVSCVHLRPDPAEPDKPPYISFPGATHEFLFMALNPEEPLPSLGPKADAQYLTPVDLATQGILQDDQAATRVLELCVRAMVERGISPDQDNRSWWERAIQATCEHERLGEHPDA